MFKEQLKLLRNQKHLSQTQLAKEICVSSNTIAMWESGEREPKNYETLEIIADFFNVNMELLLTGTIAPTRIPVLGKVVAGIPLGAIEDIIDYEEIPHSIAKSGDYFTLQIKGDSMEPRIKEGDVVIVRKQPDVESGEVAIVLVNGDEATIKKVQKFNGGINLVPSNPAYEVKTYSNDDIESLPVSIIGKVVELRAKF